MRSPILRAKRVQVRQFKIEQPSRPTDPSRACKHNVNYWRGGSFYGLGPSATGYVRGVRTKNWANTQLYCEQLEKGRRAIESSEELPPLRAPVKSPRSACG